MRDASTHKPSTNDRDLSLCVAVVSHNYGMYLTEAVESVLSQSRQPDEILLVNDASCDATNEICERYARLYPEKIRYLRNESQLGIVGTFNRAAAESRSDIICFLGADNRFGDNYLGKAMEAFAMSASNLAIVYTDFLLFGPRAREEYLRHGSERRGRILDDGFEIVFPEFSRAAFLRGSFMHGSSAYRREAFDAVGGYREKLSGPEDSDLFRRIVKAGFIAKKAEDVWLEYRQHSDEQANIVSRTKGELAFYRAYSRRLELKVQALECAFGALSPVLRMFSAVETWAFRSALRIVRSWRRLF